MAPTAQPDSSAPSARYVRRRARSEEIRHEGPCGQRVACDRPECADWKGFRTIEELPDGRRLAYCHGRTVLMADWS